MIRMAYRNSLQIMAQVLSDTKYGGQDGVSITKLTQKSNLAYSRLTVLVKNLMSSGLVNRIQFDGKKTFVITEKGQLFLEEYKKFHNFAGAFGLEI